jgi:hypothetical protein
VSVVGTFNGWDKAADPLARYEDGRLCARVDMVPGTYEYKFVVDGERWIKDPLGVERGSDGYGARTPSFGARGNRSSKCPIACDSRRCVTSRRRGNDSSRINRRAIVSNMSRDSRTNAYTVRYNDLEDVIVSSAAAASSLEVGSWIRMVSVRAAQDVSIVLIVISISPSDPAFEAAVKARFPGYTVLQDGRLDAGKNQIRFGNGPVIPPEVHGIKAGEKLPSLYQLGVKSAQERGDQLVDHRQKRKASRK